MMTRRTARSYNSVFAELKHRFPGFQPTVAHIDFEPALRQSLLDSFPKIKIRGCHFHYAQVSLSANIKFEINYEF